MQQARRSRRPWGLVLRSFSRYIQLSWLVNMMWQHPLFSTALHPSCIISCTPQPLNSCTHQPHIRLSMTCFQRLSYVEYSGHICHMLRKSFTIGYVCMRLCWILPGQSVSYIRYRTACPEHECRHFGPLRMLAICASQTFQYDSVFTSINKYSCIYSPATNSDDVRLRMQLF